MTGSSANSPRAQPAVLVGQAVERGCSRGPNASILRRRPGSRPTPPLTQTASANSDRAIRTRVDERAARGRGWRPRPSRPSNRGAAPPHRRAPRTPPVRTGGRGHGTHGHGRPHTGHPAPDTRHRTPDADRRRTAQQAFGHPRQPRPRRRPPGRRTPLCGAGACGSATLTARRWGHCQRDRTHRSDQAAARFPPPSKARLGALSPTAQALTRPAAPTPGRARQHGQTSPAHDTSRVSHSKGHARRYRSRPGSSRSTGSLTGIPPAATRLVRSALAGTTYPT